MWIHTDVATIFCAILATTVGDNTGLKNCTDDPTVLGGTSVMTFTFDGDLGDARKIRLKIKGQIESGDLLVCEWKQDNCTSQDGQFRLKEKTANSVLIQVTDITENIAVQYDLDIYFHASTQTQSCKLIMKVATERDNFLTLPTSRRPVASVTSSKNKPVAPTLPISNENVTSKASASQETVTQAFPTSTKKVTHFSPADKNSVTQTLPTSNDKTKPVLPSSKEPVSQTLPSNTKNTKLVLPTSTEPVTVTLPSSHVVLQGRGQAVTSVWPSSQGSDTPRPPSSVKPATGDWRVRDGSSADTDQRYLLLMVLAISVAIPVVILCAVAVIYLVKRVRRVERSYPSLHYGSYAASIGRHSTSQPSYYSGMQSLSQSTIGQGSTHELGIVKTRFGSRMKSEAQISRSSRDSLYNREVTKSPIVRTRRVKSCDYSTPGANNVVYQHEDTTSNLQYECGVPVLDSSSDEDFERALEV